MKLYKTLFLIILISIISMTVFSQETTSKQAFYLDQHGGLQFSLRENFTPSYVTGRTVSWIRRTSFGHAHRIGISSYADIRKDSISDIKTFSIKTIWQRMMYLTPQYRVHAYYGIGPMISYTYWESCAESKKHLGIGVYGTLGIEYFIMPTVSLFGEYTTSIEYHEELDSRDYSLLLSPKVVIGATIYF